MFTHLMVGTNDVARARKFYDPVMAALGYPLVSGDDTTKAIWYDGKSCAYGVMTPINGSEASFSNGGTIGFRVGSDAQVDAMHQLCLANGGTNEGDPGPRAGAHGARGCYARDPDGHKLAFFHS